MVYDIVVMSENIAIKILIVEDNALSRKLMVQFLQMLGHASVDTAIDGIEGLAKLNDRHFDLVFFDLFMPNMDGLEFLQQAKPLADYETGFILCSAELEQEKILEIMESGAISYLAKPITAEKLGKSIQQYYKWRVLNA